MTTLEITQKVLLMGRLLQFSPSLPFFHQAQHPQDSSQAIAHDIR
jgi:hypothetical protein